MAVASIGRIAPLLLHLDRPTEEGKVIGKGDSIADLPVAIDIWAREGLGDQVREEEK